MLKDSIPTNTATFGGEETKRGGLSWESRKKRKDENSARLGERVTYNDRPHALFKNEGGIDFLEEAKEEAVPLQFLAICQLHTA